jgi:GR25 family glycosyltransferase involved in LPS biosynthesis
MKYFFTLLSSLFFTANLIAQDAVLISEGNFVRGVIKETNFSTVTILEDDQTIKEYFAKNIQSFIWNGETYVSKPFVVKKKMEFRFFKLIESGAVNLYTYGDYGITEQPSTPIVKARPSFGVGMGTGGFGGGLGGGVSIDLGGRRNQEQTTSGPKGKITYFIEKPGTGPMQEVNLANTNAVKTILLQKLANDEELAESIKATDGFDEKNLVAYVKAYNTERN